MRGLGHCRVVYIYIYIYGLPLLPPTSYTRCSPPVSRRMSLVTEDSRNLIILTLHIYLLTYFLLTYWNCGDRVSPVRRKRIWAGSYYLLYLLYLLGWISNCAGAANVIDPVNQRCGYGFSVRRRKNCFSSQQLCRCGKVLDPINKNAGTDFRSACGKLFLKSATAPVRQMCSTQ